MDTAPQARQVLGAATEVGCAEIEVDLSALVFCGAAGLAAFIDAQHKCAVNGGLLLLCNPQRLSAPRPRAGRPHRHVDRLADVTGSPESGPASWSATSTILLLIEPAPFPL